MYCNSPTTPKNKTIMAIYKEGKGVEPYKKGGDGTKNHRK
jgi:hypothetical protein